MKKLYVFIVSTTLIGFVSTLQADIKRYDIKSGIVEYKISGGGTMMGMVKSEVSGSGKLLFKEWGNVELREEKTVNTTMGQTDKSHSMTKFDGGKAYSVDFDNKMIIKHDNPMMQSAANSNKDMQQVGKDMMVSMGGKKAGNGKILGYDCEIWELMGSKSWFHKGIPLKTTATIMGISHTQEAVKVTFDTSIPDSAFKLPDFPAKSMDEMINQRMKEAGINPQEEEEGENNMPTPEEMQQLQEMMKSFGGMMGK